MCILGGVSREDLTSKNSPSDHFCQHTMAGISLNFRCILNSHKPEVGRAQLLSISNTEKGKVLPSVFKITQSNCFVLSTEQLLM